MKTQAVILQTLVSFAAASPLVPRQAIDVDLVNSAPDPTLVTVPIGPTADSVNYDLAAATQLAVADPLTVPAATKRDLAARTACEVQPTGAGPVPDVDNDDSFLKFADFSDAATSALVPSGYQQTYTDLQASSIAYGYLGYRTLDSYDTSACAAQCDTITGCSGVNIYFERDPTVEPAADCPNPPSTTVIKCVLWGGYVAAENAKNDGQWRDDFHVVIAGSNGYMKTAVPAVSGFEGESLGNSTINAPNNCLGQNTYMGSKIFSTSIFDPSLCGAACTSQNQYNVAHPPAQGEPMICTFFTTYLMAKNGNSQGQYCAMYTQSWDSSYAVNDGQWRGQDHYTVEYAFSYSNATSSGGPQCSK
ncbi:Uu.00g108930.m01.CDS01 [Anthostomella pinea]|uniref:Uu.00g108930.m01.CDS01 n=1 Tax=Anthostomella pinea TaxID=933095 RepID=A0AAI8VF38_9PEZI|nr:Uu.00g108930.m01.CDS01 [Anthostomella pinea]